MVKLNKLKEIETVQTSLEKELVATSIENVELIQQDQKVDERKVEKMKNDEGKQKHENALSENNSVLIEQLRERVSYLESLHNKQSLVSIENDKRKSIYEDKIRKLGVELQLKTENFNKEKRT